MTLIDSYSEANINFVRWMSSAYTNIYGQTFHNTNRITLRSCNFYLGKGGSPTGSLTVSVYAHSGTFGSTGVPTGSPLAVSDPVLTSDISNYHLNSFVFTGANQIELAANTNYVIITSYTGGDASNHIDIAFDSDAPTGGGNGVEYSGGTWHANAEDYAFYVYGYDVSPLPTSHN